MDKILMLYIIIAVLAIAVIVLAIRCIYLRAVLHFLEVDNTGYYDDDEYYTG